MAFGGVWLELVRKESEGCQKSTQNRAQGRAVGRPRAILGEMVMVIVKVIVGGWVLWCLVDCGWGW